jgi:hypothetical protein
MGALARPWVFATYDEEAVAAQFERTYAQVVGEIESTRAAAVGAIGRARALGAV